MTTLLQPHQSRMKLMLMLTNISSGSQNYLAINRCCYSLTGGNRVFVWDYFQRWINSPWLVFMAAGWCKLLASGNTVIKHLRLSLRTNRHHPEGEKKSNPFDSLLCCRHGNRDERRDRFREEETLIMSDSRITMDTAESGC